MLVNSCKINSKVTSEGNQANMCILNIKPH